MEAEIKERHIAPTLLETERLHLLKRNAFWLLE